MMVNTFLMTETVVLRARSTEPATYDPFGNPVPAADVDTPSVAWLEPITSTEATDLQDQQLYGYLVFLPLTVDLDGTDAVVIYGEEYEVKGEPARQPGGFIVDGFQRIVAEKVTG